MPLAAAGVEPVTANAYLGGWGIAAALDAGADVVVCPRVTDAALVVGPAAWHSAGPPTTGTGWPGPWWPATCSSAAPGHRRKLRLPRRAARHPPARVPDRRGGRRRRAVVTKHPGTGGLVSVGTVTAQLLYEIAGPAYVNPDVVARFDTIRLDRRRPGPGAGTASAAGPPPTGQGLPQLPRRLPQLDDFVLTGLDIEAKADLAPPPLVEALGGGVRFGR